MIKNIKSGKLRRLYKKDDASGIDPMHIKRVKDILLALDSATCIDDMKVPGWDLHPLKGKKPKRWSVRVDKNWRITFTFKDCYANDVHYEDYH